MLSENIKAIRKAKGLSQEELGSKLNVVRQTISKWEKGLSVPDSDMLIKISEVLEAPVSTLLGETVVESEVDDLKTLSQKLEVINSRLAQQKISKRKTVRWLLISLCLVTALIAVVLFILNSPYLGWDYSDPENAVLGVAFHSFEWLFVRLVPVILIGAIVGIVLTGRSKLTKKKAGIAFLVCIAVLLAYALVRCGQSDNAPPQADADEIKLKIQLDLKEDIGLLLVDYDVNGKEGSGGISQADKSMIKHDDILYWEFDKQHLDNPADTVNLTVRFTVVTEYFDPNYDNIYPEEYMIPMDKIPLKANFGETYLITIRGDKTNGYQAVLEPV